MYHELSLIKKPKYLGYNDVSKRQLSEEEVTYIYNECFINFNLKNILKHPQGFEYKWLKITDFVLPDSFHKYNWTLSHDPFAKIYDKNKIELAQSIINKGTYFPICAIKENGKYRVFEGKHRITSLQLAYKLKLLPLNFKIFTIILPKELLEDTYKEKDFVLKQDLWIKNIIELRYGLEYFTNDSYKNKVENHLIKRKIKKENDYIILEKLLDMTDMYDSLVHIPYYLRDLLFKYQNIKPSKIINNEKEFEKWLDTFK